MFSDNTAVPVAVPAPDALVDEVAVEDLPGTLREKGDEVVLARGQVELDLAHRNRARPIVNGDVPVEADLRRSRARCDRTRAPSTASENGLST